MTLLLTHLPSRKYPNTRVGPTNIDKLDFQKPKLYVHRLRNHLTHWDRVTNICISKLTTTGLKNGLSPGRHQAIIWTNAYILLIGPFGRNFSEILIEI